jgi:DNA-binding response OmpR family regulator
VSAPVVLLVDDDAAIRRSVAEGLELEGFSVVPASGGRAALAALESVTPAVVVLDLAMPDLDGLEVLERLRAQGDDVPVCVLSARDEVEDRVRGLEAGADDYVVKPFAIEEVAARLRALLRRGRDRSTRISFGAITLDTATNSVDRGGGERIELTAREAQLLEMLMRNPRTVLSRRDAVERIWDGAAVENVVDRYVARLRRKLEDPLLIRTVWGVGFILQP